MEPEGTGGARMLTPSIFSEMGPIRAASLRATTPRVAAPGDRGGAAGTRSGMPSALGS